MRKLFKIIVNILGEKLFKIQMLQLNIEVKS